MVTIELLDELHTEVVSKTFYEIQLTKLDYYYNLVYSKPINKNCSQCYIEAHLMLKRFYRANIEKHDYHNSEAEKERLRKLKLAELEFGREGNYELCKWIQKRINVYQKNNSNALSK
jgi:hypothetical protein